MEVVCNGRAIFWNLNFIIFKECWSFDSFFLFFFGNFIIDTFCKESYWKVIVLKLFFFLFDNNSNDIYLRKERILETERQESRYNLVINLLDNNI